MSYKLDSVYSKFNRDYSELSDLRSKQVQKDFESLLDSESKSSNNVISRIATYVKNNPKSTSNLRLIMIKIMQWNDANLSFFNVAEQLHNDYQNNTLINANYMRNLLNFDDDHNFDNQDDDLLQNAAIEFQTADSLQATKILINDDDEPFDFSTLNS